MGGGRENSISMLEAIARVEQMTGRKLDWRYVEEERKGGHIGYISDLSKFKNHFPKWKITRGLDSILDEMIRAATDKSLRVAAGRLKSDRLSTFVSARSASRPDIVLACKMAPDTAEPPCRQPN